jgi:hypothetical protein
VAENGGAVLYSSRKMSLLVEAGARVDDSGEVPAVQRPPPPLLSLYLFLSFPASRSGTICAQQQHIQFYTRYKAPPTLRLPPSFPTSYSCSSPPLKQQQTPSPRPVSHSQSP